MQDLLGESSTPEELPRDTSAALGPLRSSHALPRPETPPQPLAEPVLTARVGLLHIPIPPFDPAARALDPVCPLTKLPRMEYDEGKYAFGVISVRSIKRVVHIVRDRARGQGHVLRNTRVDTLTWHL